jgi:hypothetical protein
MKKKPQRDPIPVITVEGKPRPDIPYRPYTTGNPTPEEFKKAMARIRKRNEEERKRKEQERGKK